MKDHNEWVNRSFNDGVFLLAGSLQSNMGVSIIALHTSLRDLEVRVKNDPFVANNVVRAEIFEISPAKADERLKFLLDK